MRRGTGKRRNSDLLILAELACCVVPPVDYRLGGKVADIHLTNPRGGEAVLRPAVCQLDCSVSLDSKLVTVKSEEPRACLAPLRPH